MKKIILFIVIGVIVLGAGIGYRYYLGVTEKQAPVNVEEKLNEILQLLQGAAQDLENIKSQLTTE